jgi:hypothetical protein
MGVVKVLVGFFLLIIGGGWYFKIYDDVFNRYIDKYIVDSSSVYWLAQDLFWNAIPFILMIGGVILLIMGGFSRRSGGSVKEQ